MSSMTISIKRNSNHAGYPVQDRFALNFDKDVTYGIPLKEEEWV